MRAGDDAEIGKDEETEECTDSKGALEDSTETMGNWVLGVQTSGGRGVTESVEAARAAACFSGSSSSLTTTSASSTLYCVMGSFSSVKSEPDEDCLEVDEGGTSVPVTSGSAGLEFDEEMEFAKAANAEAEVEAEGQ